MSYFVVNVQWSLNPLSSDIEMNDVNTSLHSHFHLFQIDINYGPKYR